MSPYCSWCGGATAATDAATDDAGRAVPGADHERCRARLATVDPPRHCGECARRMVVQVDPVGWTARCSRHGEITSADGALR